MQAGFVTKLLAGSPSRKTRLHDEGGAIVPPGRVLRNLPRAFAGGVRRLVTGGLPERPWISYDAQAWIDAFLAARPCRVLEFGSGQSTRWYADRAASLVSVESNAAWHAIVAERLSGLANVDYRLDHRRGSYANPGPAAEFDFIMIDGAWRLDCALYALEHLRPAGIIYLDNSDKGNDPEDGEIPAARALLIAEAERRGWRWREFTDFAPAQFFVQRGLLVEAGFQEQR